MRRVDEKQEDALALEYDAKWGEIQDTHLSRQTSKRTERSSWRRMRSMRTHSWLPASSLVTASHRPQSPPTVRQHAQPAGSVRHLTALEVCARYPLVAEPCVSVRNVADASSRPAGTVAAQRVDHESLVSAGGRNS